MRSKAKKICRITAAVMTIIILFLLLPSCGISIGTVPEEKDHATKVRDMEALIQAAQLQYPTRNEDFQYNVYDTYIKITKYIGDGGEVVIPSTIDDLPVYVIGPNAFKESKVQKLTIEPGVRKIQEYCFEKCEALETIQLPETILVIDEYAFQQCTSLTEITLPKSVASVSYSTFDQCSSLKTVKILNETASGSIDSGAFAGCVSLQDIYITNSITFIADNAFSDVPEYVVFYGPVGCAAAEYCADNFYEYVIANDEAEIPNESEESSTEEGAVSDAPDDGSIWTLIIIALIFFGIIGGLIAFLIIRRRRRW